MPKVIKQQVVFCVGRTCMHFSSETMLVAWHVLPHARALTRFTCPREKMTNMVILWGLPFLRFGFAENKWDRNLVSMGKVGRMKFLHRAYFVYQHSKSE